MNTNITFSLILSIFLFVSCDEDKIISLEDQWNRSPENPIFRDLIPTENYQAASDPHVFYNDLGQLNMIYTGDHDGFPAIKLAKGTNHTDWVKNGSLLYEIGPSNLDRNKETGFYRKSNSGKHQIYYIGYPNEESYESQIFLAEADSLEGPYTQMESPIVPKGLIAGEDVYCMTSPSVVEFEDKLYMTFIGWDASPNEVTTVWILGAISTDEGKTWSDFQKVNTRIGMEGQVTKVNESSFIATRTGEYGDAEAIFYSTASHPFGPWTETTDPIIVQLEDELEKNEVIAPQITIDPDNGNEYLFYTGADYQIGWWIMMAENN